MMAARSRDFAVKYPNTTIFGAGAAAQGAYSGGRAIARTRKRKRQFKNTVRRKAPRKAGKPPNTPSSRVSAKYAVADRMTKFKKAKLTKQKVPKSAMSHYKEFGQFTAERCMYINHEHWGSDDKFWYGIGLGLAKKLLPMAKIYNGKSLNDPCIGPRTNGVLPDEQIDNKSGNTLLRLYFITEGSFGQTTRTQADIAIEDVTLTPDKYRSMDAIARTITGVLQAKYTTIDRTYLQEAAFLRGDAGFINVDPVFIQNLDDAEICLYVKSLIKLQNVTPADHAVGADANEIQNGAGMDRHAIDANPLAGRVYSAKGFFPDVDGDIHAVGDRTLDSYFGGMNPDTGGITLLGWANSHTANDLGKIAHVPKASEIYGNQAVMSGNIAMAAGAMKFHKTTFTMRKTFKDLARFTALSGGIQQTMQTFGRHTLFGFHPAHNHGEDTVSIGYNRDTDVSCFIKHKRIVHPLKAQYTNDHGATTTSIAPTEYAPPME